MLCAADQIKSYFHNIGILSNSCDTGGHFWLAIPEVLLSFYATCLNIRCAFHAQFFLCNSNSMEISFCSHPSCSEVISVEFCTWQESCAVVASVKFCSCMIPYTSVTLKPIFHQIWITIEKSFVKWPPGLHWYLAWVTITRLWPCWWIINVIYNTVKPVYNDHPMGYFSSFWSSSRWPRATYMSSRRQTLLARVNWYLQSSLKHIGE